MARYQVAGVSATLAAAGNFFDIRTTSTDRVRVLELGVFLSAATASTVLVARSTTVGTASTTVVPVAGEPGDAAATALVGTAWSAAPATTAVPVRRINFPANIGAGVIWTFGLGDLIIPVSASLLVYSTAAASAVNFYCVLDE